MTSTPVRPKIGTLARADLTTRGGSETEVAKAGLVDAAHRAIKEAIRENVFPPGYQAAEAEIAGQLGMSQTPIHEAMTVSKRKGWSASCRAAASSFAH